jgi:hypothetical protein
MSNHKTLSRFTRWLMTVSSPLAWFTGALDREPKTCATCETPRTEDTCSWVLNFDGYDWMPACAGDAVSVPDLSDTHPFCPLCGRRVRIQE